MGITHLPLLNAFLNSTSAIFLLFAHHAAKLGRTSTHKKFMIAAIVVSSLFLASYLLYHSIHGTQHFAGQGFIRPVYFLILGTHTVLAAAVVPLVLVTLSRGLKAEFVAHKRMARWTYPIWLYVSVTGVVIYLMLYQLYPASPVN